MMLTLTGSASAQTAANEPLSTQAPACRRVVKASVVALDQVVMINRLGAVRPGGMIYALRRDVVANDGGAELRPGQVQLRRDKRPRPIVLRVNQGDCLEIEFQNLLNPDLQTIDPMQPITRIASIHVAGMQLVKTIADDGLYAGANPPAPDGNLSGLVAPGKKAVYTLYAEKEGTNLLYSAAGDFNGFSTNQLGQGLFGAVNVQPEDAEWYRGQVAAEDLKLATTGQTADNHPIINYDAVYPPGHPRAGTPILKMLSDDNQIVHTDLTAVITGKNHGRFKADAFPANPATPDRSQPYREVTIHYHESQDVVQPFPYSYNPATQHTPDLNSGMDSFAINYGIAGIASEIIANRMGVGPSRDCSECKFEEFFLSSWAGGDPAMVVDTPANAPCTGSPTTPAAQVAQLETQNVQMRDQRNSLTAVVTPPSCTPYYGDKATRAFYPDDPSNVYHSYLGDHVRFRILHAGQSVHHVHHHHAHQWLHSPNSDEGHYLDSQAIGPGTSFSLELVYAGSGNRNYTVGDSIFHCHFYPHFASGMWALYRVHDVFEAGTELDANGRPKSGARALPDPEIRSGTPIPAVVPLPTLAMAPMPAAVVIADGQVKVTGEGHPGYPFFVPGVSGHRPPHPPLDFAVQNGEKLDGGLPRHLILGATVVNEQHTTLDFSKDLGPITAVELPEEGTEIEKRAMAYFGQREHPSFTSDGKAANFITNGLPRKTAQNPTGAQPGAPFADPGVCFFEKNCKNGEAVGNFRRYKGVNLQLDTVFNKKGWHFPQQRMMALWGDVKDYVNGVKPPEPLFFRANSGDVVEYWHTNLVPAYYELDDFQVRTPTDILGQHIHLVKFDVMASDGAANGFNYEDGTFSPDEVRSRIDGINQAGGLWSSDRLRQRTLQAKSIAELGEGPGAGSKSWVGAQATVQRWYVDPVEDLKGFDRTLMTVFTHDHYGPSTHQMAGLYGGLLVEPRGSRWTAPDGTPFGSRFDGGPTSYAANILPRDQADSYREFALAWQDLQLVYQPGSKSKPDCYPGQTPLYNNCNPVAPGATYQGWADPGNAINCPTCGPGQTLSPPNAPVPLLISDFGAGIFSMNYRGEPLPFRLALPSSPVGLDPKADKYAGDLSHAFRSITRYDSALNTQPLGNGFPQKPISGGMLPTDPFTPLLRTYENDKVQIRVLTGAHTSMHDFSLHGMKWLAEPFNTNSGYRNSQLVILSEHYEMLFQTPRTSAKSKIADYIYNPSSSYEGLMNGAWGLLRSYKGTKDVAGLQPLPNNPAGSAPAGPNMAIPPGITANCDTGQPCRREFKISALTIQQALGNDKTLVYNSRGVFVSPGVFDANNPLEDPNAIIYVRDEDLDARGQLKAGVPLEPLTLRAAAGDWLRVTLTNRFTGNEPVFTQPQPAVRPGAVAAFVNGYAGVQINASTSIGVHPQLVSFDITQSSGINAGVNPVQTVAPDDAKAPGQKFPAKQYLWYAGNLETNPDGSWKATPVESGASNLMPSDPLLHVFRGLFGALIIEPQGATWKEDPDSRASATVFKKDGSAFREFVLMAQNDVDIQINGNSNMANGNALAAFNYKTEPFFYRYGSRLTGLWLPSPGTNPPADWTNLQGSDLGNIGALYWTGTDTSKSVSNELVGGDPQTPIFQAPAGMPVRFRLLDPGGIGDNQQAFELTGHLWQEEPYTNDSKEIADTKPNPASNWTGMTSSYGPTSHFDIVIASAGGKFKVPGDYLYRSWTQNQYQVGLWGLFRVAPWSGAGLPDTVKISAVNVTSSGYAVSGVTTVSPQTRKFATCVGVSTGGGSASCNVRVDAQGRWTYTGTGQLPATLTVKSELGGVATYRSYGPPAAAPKFKAAPKAQAAPASKKRLRH